MEIYLVLMLARDVIRFEYSGGAQVFLSSIEMDAVDAVTTDTIPADESDARQRLREYFDRALDNTASL